MCFVCCYTRFTTHFRSCRVRWVLLLACVCGVANPYVSNGFSVCVCACRVAVKERGACMYVRCEKKRGCVARVCGCSLPFTCLSYLLSTVVFFYLYGLSAFLLFSYPPYLLFTLPPRSLLLLSCYLCHLTLSRFRFLVNYLLLCWLFNL